MRYRETSPERFRGDPVEGDDIRFGEQLVQLHVLQARAGIGELVIGQDLHAETSADIPKDAADLTGADEADGLAMEVKAGQSGQAEIEFPGADVCLVGPAVDGQKQCHGVLRHRVGRVGGDPEHVDLSKGRPGVHVVEARAAQGDDLHAQLMEPVHNGLIDGVVDKDADPVESGGQGDGILVEFGLVIFDLQVGPAGEVVKAGHVIGLGVKKSDFHRQRSFLCSRLGSSFAVGNIISESSAENP